MWRYAGSSDDTNVAHSCAPASADLTDRAPRLKGDCKRHSVSPAQMEALSRHSHLWSSRFHRRRRAAMAWGCRRNPANTAVPTDPYWPCAACGTVSLVSSSRRMRSGPGTVQTMRFLLRACLRRARQRNLRPKASLSVGTRCASKSNIPLLLTLPTLSVF